MMSLYATDVIAEDLIRELRFEHNSPTLSTQTVRTRVVLQGQSSQDLYLLYQGFLDMMLSTSAKPEHMQNKQTLQFYNDLGFSIAFISINLFHQFCFFKKEGF